MKKRRYADTRHNFRQPRPIRTILGFGQGGCRILSERRTTLMKLRHDIVFTGTRLAQRFNNLRFAVRRRGCKLAAGMNRKANVKSRWISNVRNQIAHFYAKGFGDSCQGFQGDPIFCAFNVSNIIARDTSFFCKFLLAQADLDSSGAHSFAQNFIELAFRWHKRSQAGTACPFYQLLLGNCFLAFFLGSAKVALRVGGQQAFLRAKQ